MATYLRQKPQAWFWIVAILFLSWGAIGVYACVQQFRLGAEAMGPATDYDRTLYASLPGWYNLVFAVAVGTGFLAGVALLLRSSAARLLFVVSLVAVVIQFGFLFGATDIVATKGAGAVVPFPVFVIAVTLAGVWFASYARQHGWTS